MASEWQNASLLSDIRIRTPVSPEKLPEFPKPFTEKNLKISVIEMSRNRMSNKINNLPSK